MKLTEEEFDTLMKLLDNPTQETNAAYVDELFNTIKEGGLETEKDKARRFEIAMGETIRKRTLLSEYNIIKNKLTALKSLLVEQLESAEV